MPKIICTISPTTPQLKNLDFARINGSFGQGNDMIELIKKSRDMGARSVVLDIPGKRK